MASLLMADKDFYVKVFGMLSWLDRNIDQILEAFSKDLLIIHF